MIALPSHALAIVVWRRSACRRGLSLSGPRQASQRSPTNARFVTTRQCRRGKRRLRHILWFRQVGGNLKRCDDGRVACLVALSSSISGFPLQKYDPHGACLMRRALIIIAVLTFATALTLAIATIADNPDPSAASKFDPQLRIDTGGITARLAVSPNRALAVSVHAGSVVRFIDLNAATCSVITGDIRAGGVAISPDGSVLAMGGKSGSHAVLEQWDLRTRTVRTLFRSWRWQRLVCSIRPQRTLCLRRDAWRGWNR